MSIPLCASQRCAATTNKVPGFPIYLSAGATETILFRLLQICSLLSVADGWSPLQILLQRLPDDGEERPLQPVGEQA
eukprot:1178797-Prorocentrum_minimum.AAC.5